MIKIIFFYNIIWWQKIDIIWWLIKYFTHFPFFNFFWNIMQKFIGRIFYPIMEKSFRISYNDFFFFLKRSDYREFGDEYEIKIPIGNGDGHVVKKQRGTFALHWHAKFFLFSPLFLFSIKNACWLLKLHKISFRTGLA